MLIGTPPLPILGSLNEDDWRFGLVVRGIEVTFLGSTLTVQMGIFKKSVEKIYIFEEKSLLAETVTIFFTNRKPGEFSTF